MLDIVEHVTEENDKRRVSLPIWDDRYEWWSEAVRNKIRPRDPAGQDQKTMAHKLGYSPSEVSRAISREKPLYDIVIAISDELKLPYPVIFPESEEEALHLAMQRRLFRRDAQLEQVRPQVPKPIASLPKQTRPKRATKRPR